jgi:serine/threonine-protein kinase
VYFVMGYVPGRTLGQRVRDNGPLRPDDAARILHDVAWALGYAHAQGVVHRDVKPDNILLEEPSGRAMVTDFGIAQVAEAEPISGGHRAGTRGFMSPEQMEGAPLDGRSDLYALGLVGVYALTGSGVAEGEDAEAALVVAPGWLRDALVDCLHECPEDRFDDAAALAEALESRSLATPEMPPALRVWLTRTQPLVVAASLWSLFMSVGATFMFFRWLSGDGHALNDLLRQLVFFCGPWVVLAIARLFETRRALAAGYDLTDFRAAAAVEALRKREEYAYDSAGRSRVGAVARRVAIGALVTVFGLALLEGSGLITISNYLLNRIAIGLALTAAVSGVVGIVTPGRWSKQDVPSDLSARFWKSKFGAWAVRLSGWGLGRRARAADAMHRATEVLLGDELEELYDGLPGEVRRGLPEVPGTIRRLTANAESLRGQVEAARALGQAVDRQQGQLMEAVAALETLRVGLLKLRAGTVSIEGFTTDLDAVREVGERVDLLVDARRELERGLRRGVLNTPT